MHHAPQISIDDIYPTPDEEPILHAIVSHWATSGGEMLAATFNDATLRRLTAYMRAHGEQVIMDLIDRAIARKGTTVQFGYVMTSLANYHARPRHSTDIFQRIMQASGAKGGQSTSPAKVAAARANGAKGGRPRKVAPVATSAPAPVASAPAVVPATTPVEAPTAAPDAVLTASPARLRVVVPTAILLASAPVEEEVDIDWNARYVPPPSEPVDDDNDEDIGRFSNVEFDAAYALRAYAPPPPQPADEAEAAEWRRFGDVPTTRVRHCA